MKPILSQWTVVLMLLGGVLTHPRTVLAADGGTNSLGPRIHFAAPIYDFGKVASGEIVKHEFVFTNTGNQTLFLTQVRPSCGCTELTNWSRQVEPAQHGKIPVELRTANFNGPINKSITVVCNDTNTPLVLLQVKGTLWRPVEAIPQMVGFSGVFDTPASTTKTVRIVNNEDTPLKLEPPQSNHKAFTAELKTVQPGKEYQLMVQLVPSILAGNAYGEITVKTSSTYAPVLKISTWAVASPPVIITPAQLILPAGPLSAKTMRTITVRNMASNPLTVSDPVVSDQGVAVELKEMQPGKYFFVQLTFPEGYQIPPQVQVEARVESSHPQFQLIRVPIRQQPAPVLAANLPKMAQVPATNQLPRVPAPATPGGLGGTPEPPQAQPPLPFAPPPPPTAASSHNPQP